MRPSGGAAPRFALFAAAVNVATLDVLEMPRAAQAAGWLWAAAALLLFPAAACALARRLHAGAGAQRAGGAYSPVARRDGDGGDAAARRQARQQQQQARQRPPASYSEAVFRRSGGATAPGAGALRVVAKVAVVCAGLVEVTCAAASAARSLDGFFAADFGGTFALRPRPPLALEAATWDSESCARAVRARLPGLPVRECAAFSLHAGPILTLGLFALFLLYGRVRLDGDAAAAAPLPAAVFDKARDDAAAVVDEGRDESGAAHYRHASRRCVAALCVTAPCLCVAFATLGVEAGRVGETATCEGRCGRALGRLVGVAAHNFGFLAVLPLLGDAANETRCGPPLYAAAAFAAAVSLAVGVCGALAVESSEMPPTRLHESMADLFEAPDVFSRAMREPARLAAVAFAVFVAGAKVPFFLTACVAQELPNETTTARWLSRRFVLALPWVGACFFYHRPPALNPARVGLAVAVGFVIPACSLAWPQTASPWPALVEINGPR